MNRLFEEYSGLQTAAVAKLIPFLATAPTSAVVGTCAGINWVVGAACKSPTVELPIDVLVIAGAGVALALMRQHQTRARC